LDKKIPVEGKVVYFPTGKYVLQYLKGSILRFKIKRLIGNVNIFPVNL